MNVDSKIINNIADMAIVDMPNNSVAEIRKAIIMALVTWIKLNDGAVLEVLRGTLAKEEDTSHAN